jgi:hypothetical protein
MFIKAAIKNLFSLPKELYISWEARKLMNKLLELAFTLRDLRSKYKDDFTFYLMMQAKFDELNDMEHDAFIEAQDVLDEIGRMFLRRQEDSDLLDIKYKKIASILTSASLH